MAKRFTDTDKWKRPWWRHLSPEAKIAWIYMVDNCDHAGIWIADFGLMNFQASIEVDEETLEAWFGDKIRKVDDDKFFIPSFVEFQYGELRANNTVHLSVINALKKTGVDIGFTDEPSMRPSAILARLSFKKKKEIFAQDFYTCGYCGSHGDDKTLQIDHIVPRSKGGDNEDENLVTCCHACNVKKSDLEVGVFVSKHNLESTMSENLKQKIGLNKKLNGPFKDLYSPKDKDKDKDKEKDKDKDKEICAKIEIIYQTLYPLKKGKSNGIKEILKQIKTPEDLEDFEKSVKKYADNCRTNRVDPKYIKHFSTFVNTWRDWLDPDAGKSLTLKNYENERDTDHDAEVAEMWGT